MRLARSSIRHPAGDIGEGERSEQDPERCAPPASSQPTPMECLHIDIRVPEGLVVEGRIADRLAPSEEGSYRSRANRSRGAVPDTP